MLIIPIILTLLSIIIGACGLFVAIVGIGNIVASKRTQTWLDEADE